MDELSKKEAIIGSFYLITREDFFNTLDGRYKKYCTINVGKNGNTISWNRVALEIAPVIDLCILRDKVYSYNAKSCIKKYSLLLIKLKKLLHIK